MRRLFLKSLAAAAFALSAGVALAQNNDFDPENILNLEIAGQANGVVQIILRPDIAPLHVARIKELTRSGAYDGVAFHRVIDGFMAQTGDVQYGLAETYQPANAGRGGSELPDVPAEFSDLSFDTGVLGMARSQNPDSANAQFFIMFTRYPSLDGQYTVFGRVFEGMDIVQAIKRGDQSANGAVNLDPDYIARAWISADN
ncbi:MAG: peptidylprolyl isomerase [Rhodobacteraceae bacterium]|nr:peptidylprolyl isomerase [Paracoccaceae bacterium]